MNHRSVTAVSAAFLLSACATPHVVEVSQIGDDAMGCEQLQAAVADANRFEQDARRDRGVTGTNVAAAVLFWPALVGTYMNTDEAIKAARDRRDSLTTLYNRKNCGGTA